jgi:hypothetical protein
MLSIPLEIARWTRTARTASAYAAPTKRLTTPGAIPDRGAGRSVSEDPRDSNRQANVGRDVTDFPDDLVSARSQNK